MPETLGEAGATGIQSATRRRWHRAQREGPSSVASAPAAIAARPVPAQHRWDPSN